MRYHIGGIIPFQKSKDPRIHPISHIKLITRVLESTDQGGE